MNMSMTGSMAVVLGALASYPANGTDVAQQWSVFETSFTTKNEYADPFTDVEVNVVFSQGGTQWIVPAFWAGDKKWTVRFAPPAQGNYTYRVECSDKENAGLNGKEQTLQVTGYTGANPLLKHGFVKAAPGKGYFEHADGTPFLWLADTWWKCLCKRMTWEGFQELTADRKAKGFSVVQIVCGPYPDENFFQPSLENEGGQPYLAKDMRLVNPKYFEYADRRFKHLVDAGIVPAIVGAWGRGDCNSMDAFGAVSIKRHWRNLIARYGAYPVMWILAGEIADETKWGQGPWAEIAKYVREIDPYKHPLTCHTGQGRRGAEADVCLIDYDMVGGNHDERQAIANGTLTLLTAACAKKPAMPVLCGETCYEGHMQQGFGDVQRHIFWRNMLSGAAGHTYGAAGIWHAGVEGDHGNWGAWDRQPYDWTTWKEGMKYPGSTQLGLGKKLLEQYPWSRFEAHPEWAPGCHCAGIPGEVRFVYLPRRNIYNWDGPEVKDLEPDVDWHVYYFDPATGRKFDQGTVKATAKTGDAAAKPVSFKKNVPSPQDWVLVLQRASNISDWTAKTYDDGKGHTLPYRLFIPDVRKDSEKYPLILYFHGAGGRGNDNLRQITDVSQIMDFAEPMNQQKRPCFILAPQCPNDLLWANMSWGEPVGAGKFSSITWPMEASLALLDSLLRQYPEIDPSKVYVMGPSMGGYATWDAVCRFPNKFRAAVPICGGGDPTVVAGVPGLKNVRLWAFHCADDPVVPAGRSREMINAMKSLNGIEPRYTEFPNGGHDAYSRALTDINLHQWLFDSSGTEPEDTAK